MAASVCVGVLSPDQFDRILLDTRVQATVQLASTSLVNQPAAAATSYMANNR
jgi:hypothetical protein